LNSEADELWRDYFNNRCPELKEKIILHYAHLVKNIANKVSYYLPTNFIKDDLYSYGVFGLIEAIERYNPEIGIPFAGYAVKRIKGSIIDGIRKEDWVPASVRKKAKIISQTYQKIETNLLRSATDEEIAAELHISVNELAVWLKQIQYVTLLSLDEPLTETSYKIESIPDKYCPDPLNNLEVKETKNILADAVGDLPEKERMVVTLFYYEGLTNKEIAELLKLSDSRVSQLHTKAIFRLRGKLARVKKSLE